MQENAAERRAALQLPKSKQEIYDGAFPVLLDVKQVEENRLLPSRNWLRRAMEIYLAMSLLRPSTSQKSHLGGTSVLQDPRSIKTCMVGESISDAIASGSPVLIYLRRTDYSE
jgi:hypothetical protein